MKAFKVLVLLILTAFFGWFSIEIVHAEEVPIAHTEDVYYTSTYHTTSDYTISVTTDSWNYCPEPTQTNWIGGNLQRDIRTLYKAPYPTTIEGTGTSNAGYYMNVYDSIQGYYNPAIPAFTVTLQDAYSTLDTSGLSAGYYRYIVHFWYGVAFSNANNTAVSTFNPSYTGISSYTEGNTTIVFNGLDPCQNYFAGSNYPMRSDLLSFTLDTVFYCDGNTNEIEFNIGYYISNMGKQLISYDLGQYAIGRLYWLNIWSNNRYYTELYGNVEPPVTPTPSPTPYPGQDTQESINQGVQVIVNALDVSATPIPTPADLTIDETIFDALNDLTLPDVSPAQETFTNLWAIFTPLWPFVAGLAGSLLFAGIFMYCLRGHFI